MTAAADIKMQAKEQAPPTAGPPVVVVEEAPMVDASKKQESKLIMAKDWHVDTVPPKSSTKGKLLPKFLTHQRRRISVEVHRFYEGEKTAKEDKAKYYDECFVRVLDPTSKVEMKKSKKHKRDAKKGLIDEADDHSRMSDFPDDDSTVAGATEYDLEMPSYDGWSEVYNLPISAVTYKGVTKNRLDLIFQYRSIKQNRNIYFDSEHEAGECLNFIRYQKAEEEKRKKQKFSQNVTELKVNPLEKLSLLLEIVGASDLPASDLISSDPFVIVFFNHKKVHQTAHISKSLDPIWTLKTGALFLLEVNAQELFEGDGLHFDVMDYDTVGKNDRLGHCAVEPKTIFKAKGERMKLELEGKGSMGTLAIRIRHATPYDIQFMKEYHDVNNKKGHAGIEEMIKVAHTNKGGKSAIRSVLSRNEKIEKHGMAPPIKKIRVRPGPDPKRPEETEWMTKDLMDEEMMHDSREWVDAGSGSLGRIFVEVLQCNELPNLDTGGFAGNKTDAFVALVYEDVWAQTDIIDDDLDPQWMPWTKRAFIFHMFHSSSELYLGAFDYDGADEHDLIGRVAVNVSNLQPDTTYILKYDLYRSGKHTLREPRGTVTIRLRMEIDDDRKLLLSTLEPPKSIYVNVKTKKDFKVLSQLCNGDIDMDSYSLKTIFTYIDELQSYQSALLYVQEGVISLLFWRGNHDVNMFGKKFSIPLHSMAAFLGSVLLVEYPQLVPSAFFASISWLLNASMFFRRQHPNAWRRCKSFTDILWALIYGDSFPPANIQPLENNAEIVAYEEYWLKKVERDKKLAAEAQVEAEEDLADNEAAAAEIGDTNTDISTKKKGLIPISVDPIRPYMEPFQVYLEIATRLVRYIRNVIMWEECYIAFWLTFGCGILSAACLFVPWFFVIRWTSRLIVWTVFGPWMRAVDIYYWTPLENMSDAELAEAKKKRKELKKKFLAERVELARIERESATKLRVMKKYMFGKFIMKVPVLKEDRWQDIPLPESTATPYASKPLALAELAMKEAGYRRTRIPGQQLEGDMIPSMETKGFTDAPPGQATKKHAQPESDSAAMAKVGSLVAGAAVITYYAVPMVTSAFSSLS